MGYSHRYRACPTEGVAEAIVARFYRLLFQFVLFPLLFLSGAVFPVESLPEPLSLLASINPLTYGIDGLRAVMLDTSAYPQYPLAADVGVLVCLVGRDGRRRDLLLPPRRSSPTVYVTELGRAGARPVRAPGP